MKCLFHLVPRPWRLAALPLLALAACQTPEAPPAPPDLLPKEQVVELLTELHILEARLENSRISPDSARALFQTQQKQFLWQRKVSDSAFQQSYRYYSIHGEDMDEIYGSVIDSLNARQYKLGTQQAKK